MIRLVVLLACAADRPDDPVDGPSGDAVGAAAAPAGGWTWVASLVLGTAPGEVRFEGAVAEPAWDVADDAQHALVRVPALPVGPAQLQVGGETLPFEVTAPWFVEVGPAVGLATPHDVSDAPPGCSQAQTGVGFADVDLDGDLDGFFGHFGAPGRLYENAGDTSGDGLPDFADRGTDWGLPDVDSIAGVFFADWDDDGDPDLLLGRVGSNVALENRMIPDGSPSWRDVTAISGLGGTNQRTMGFGFGDYDGDGDLDVYEVNHSLCFPDDDPTNDQRSGDHLWRNDGGHVFADVSDDLDPDVLDRFGFSAIWLDLDRDADQDLWVVNDWTTGSGRSAVWRNDGPDGADGWRFTNITDESGISPIKDASGGTINAMGGAVGDVDRDGLPDFAFTNLGNNGLVLSGADGGWSLASAALGVERATLPWDTQSATWGVHLADLDLDRDLDVVYIGGALKWGAAQPHALFENTGSGGQWIDRTWDGGLSSPRHGKASAQLDLDGDGLLDLVVANWGDVPEVWHNRFRNGDDSPVRWLAIDPAGDGVTVNREGFGAIVEVTFDDGIVETCFHNPVPSLGGTSDPACWFGLGEATVTRVDVVWPDGVRETVPVSTTGYPWSERRLRVER
ncbi:MAG: CRTAC1 family protein [Deltaproteobacteria bacterium]|nr:CRTAC1 family protein [Deltaproteobacteria bacterium]